MLTIYAIPVSLYCAKLRILLRNKNLEWQELLPPGGYGSSEYKEIIPSGNLPALVDGDFILADSEAIAEYLEEKYQQPPMLPTNTEARAKVRERSRFHDTRFEPELRALFPNVYPGNRDNDKAALQSRVLSQRLAQFGTMLDGYDPLDEENLTLADCGFAITFEWLGAFTPILDLEISWPTSVNEYRAHIATYPAVAAELLEYRPKIKTFLHSPGHYET